MYAIVSTGGKQLRVNEGLVVKVEKIEAAVGDKLELNTIFYADDSTMLCGDDAKKVTVSCEVVAQGLGDKIIVYKYKAKKNERRRQGHRQPYTALKITSIKL